jgi:hypothetical protein
VRTFGKVLRWTAVIYAIVVVATAAIVLVIAETARDPGFIDVYLIVVTLPLSMVASLLFINSDNTAVVLVAQIASGFIQAAVLWTGGTACLQAARKRRERLLVDVADDEEH